MTSRVDDKRPFSGILVQTCRYDILQRLRSQVPSTAPRCRVSRARWSLNVHAIMHEPTSSLLYSPLKRVYCQFDCNRGTGSNLAQNSAVWNIGLAIYHSILLPVHACTHIPAKVHVNLKAENMLERNRGGDNNFRSRRQNSTQKHSKLLS